MPDTLEPRFDAFDLEFDARNGVGTARIDAWAQFIPSATPTDLKMSLGAGKWDGSGNGNYYSDTAPDGFDESKAYHRVLQFSRSAVNQKWSAISSY
jgi:hypothetical protein